MSDTVFFSEVQNGKSSRYPFMQVFRTRVLDTHYGKPFEKKSVFFQKGGVMSETKLFEELLCLDIFQEEGGGLPNSKVFEELFCLILEIYQEGGGGYLIPRLLRNFSACVWTFFRRKGGGSTLFQR